MMMPLAKSSSAQYDGGGRHSRPAIEDHGTNLVDTAKPIAKVVATYFGGPIGAMAVDKAYDMRKQETGRGNEFGDGILNKAADAYGGQSGDGSGSFDISKVASFFK
jgi:hypothetical protein